MYPLVVIYLGIFLVQAQDAISEEAQSAEQAKVPTVILSCCADAVLIFRVFSTSCQVSQDLILDFGQNLTRNSIVLSV